MNDKDEPIYTFVRKRGFSTPYDINDQQEGKLMRFKTVFGYAFIGKDYIEIISENDDTYHLIGKPHRLSFKILKSEEKIIEIMNSEDERFRRQIDICVENDEAFVLGLMVGVIATYETTNSRTD